MLYLKRSLGHGARELQMPQRERRLASAPFPLCFGQIVPEESAVKVLSSLKSAKQRHRDCKVVRRRGKVFVICKSNPRFKARQR